MIFLGTHGELNKIRLSKIKFSVGGGILEQINNLAYNFTEFSTQDLESAIEQIYSTGSYTRTGEYVRPHTYSNHIEPPLTTTWESPFGIWEIHPDQTFDVQTPQHYQNYEIRVDTSSLYSVTASTLA